MTIKATHPSGITLTFNSDKHEYLLSDGTKLTSVTTLVGKNFPKFDAENIAAKKAKKEGVTAQSLLDQWEANRVSSAAFGTKIHSLIETIIKARDFDAADSLAVNDREKSYLSAAKAAIYNLGLQYEFISTEQIVFSPDLKVAGTIDCLLRHRKTKEYVIVDWKTSKELKTEGFNGETGFGPCKSIPNANYHTYSLQLSAYQALLLREGYIPERSKISGMIISFKEINQIIKPIQTSTINYSEAATFILGIL